MEGERTYQTVEIKTKTRDTKELNDKIQEYTDKGCRLVQAMGLGFYLFDTTDIKVE